MCAMIYIGGNQYCGGGAERHTLVVDFQHAAAGHKDVHFEICIAMPSGIPFVGRIAVDRRYLQRDRIPGKTEH